MVEMGSLTFSLSKYLYIKNPYTTFVSWCSLTTLHVTAVKARRSWRVGKSSADNSVMSFVVVLVEVSRLVGFCPLRVRHD